MSADQIIIRDEVSEDVSAIHELTKIAFAPMPFSAGDEQHLIDALRADGELPVSLVAELKGEIVGHIAFSRVWLNGNPGDWFDLGPVSVKPDLQSRGIGSQLINHGLEQIKQLGAEGCVLIGYPSYYGRFGFRHDPDLTFNGKVNANFQHITFVGETPKAKVTFRACLSQSHATSSLRKSPRQGKHKNESNFSLLPKRYFHRQSLQPLVLTSKETSTRPRV
ncbi:GNAT family N-acetyltransferase [Erythrobacter rubeus]|uniref:GNAT family N-acetyltransferase n=1 Tax=Erythrobacter rubeus TaxID=2760803 RepID=UPI0018F8C60E|nr:N-acetyltransferase [Erythrobacter rubeus]